MHSGRSLLLAAAAALALAACGSSGGGGSTATSSAEGAFPVRIANAFGTTIVPAAPERVATVGFNEQDFALALGVEPVAVREFIGNFPYKTRPWAPGANDPAPAYVGGDEIDFERLAATRPDVILGVYSFIDKTAYGKLARLAPTLAQRADAPEGGTPWDQQLLQDGRALGREARARQVIADVDGRFAAVRKRHPEFRGKRLVVAFQQGDDVFSLGPDDLRQQFFTDLGFATPKGAGQDGISRERYDELDQDVVVLITDADAGISRDPLFRRLDAVREGRVITVKDSSNFAGALGFNSPLSRPYLLRQVESQLAAAVDGDPATKVPPTS